MSFLWQVIFVFFKASYFSVSGKLYGWGSNRRKQLLFDKMMIKAEDYDESKQICYRPTLLNSVFGDTHEWVDCAAGAHHSIAKTSMS